MNLIGGCDECVIYSSADPCGPSPTSTSRWLHGHDSKLDWRGVTGNCAFLQGRTRYHVKFDKPANTLLDEWCRENCLGRFYVTRTGHHNNQHQYGVRFEDPRDGFQFSLMFDVFD